MLIKKKKRQTSIEQLICVLCICLYSVLSVSHFLLVRTSMQTCSSTIQTQHLAVVKAGRAVTTSGGFMLLSCPGNQDNLAC